MFVVNDDLSIYATRGDIVCLNVSATDDSTGGQYEFQPGDIVRMKVFGKKDAETVYLSKDFPVVAKTDSVGVMLTEQDTKIGDVISKPTDYWYEIELNPYTNPQTIVGYDEDGAKIFKLFPEGKDLVDEPTDPEDIPVVDKDLDLTSSRPVENKAIARAMTLLKNDLATVDARLTGKIKENKNTAKELNEALLVERARIDNLLTGATAEGSEVVDIRVGADGKTYGSAGTAVRSQFAELFSNVSFIKTPIAVELEVGSLSNGVEVDTSNRARFSEKVEYTNATVKLNALPGYYFGYAVYDANGNYDGVDRGWTYMGEDEEVTLAGNGYLSMNFCRSDNANITKDDITALHSAISIEQISVLEQIDELREELTDGFTIEEAVVIEVGSISNGALVYANNRARFANKVSLTPKTTVRIEANGSYMFGYAVYDEDGNYDGVDHGWNAMTSNVTLEFTERGYIRLNFTKTNNAIMTEEDIATLTELVTVTGRETVVDIVENIRDLQTANKISPLVNSVTIEHGRYNGASYVFARIPKVTNYGTKLYPKVRLTSESGTADGMNVSALAYAQRNKTIFVLNAGLFNTTTKIPVGQTVIDGVSITNEPMTDDMGSPISDVECYPLCIDANGDLSAPYDRSVDTADMISDGVMYAVTGWGKVVDNFKACSDTVENEIVHKYTYIRQVIGQFQNGDYFVCTVDQSRGSVENEAGLTYSALAELLIGKGVKFAYSLDGGGSAETVIGLRQLNPIYEGTMGRPVPTVISFEQD